MMANNNGNGLDAFMRVAQDAYELAREPNAPESERADARNAILAYLNGTGQLNGQASTGAGQSVRTRGRDLVDALDPFARGEQQFLETSSGFELFQLAAGKVIVLAAGPGSGKTLLASQLTVDALLANPEIRAVIVNVEMATDILINRQLARLGRIPLPVILNDHATLRTAYLDNLHDAQEQLRSILPRLDFITGRAAHSLDAVDADVKADTPDLLILDYLQRIRPDKSHGSLREDMNHAMGLVRGLADLGVCVLVVSAISRQPTRNGSNYTTPGLGSARESGELDYGPDDFWTLAPATNANASKNQIVMRRWKARNGELAAFPTSLDGLYQRFTAIPRPQDREGNNGSE